VAPGRASDQDAAERASTRAALLGAGLLTALAAAGFAAALARPQPRHPPADAAAAQWRVPINTADAPTLQLLPQVGPSRAEAIIEARRRGGPFRSPRDLQRVSGIAVKRAAAIAPYIRFDPAPTPSDQPSRSSSSGADHNPSPARQTTRPAPTPTNAFIPPCDSGSTTTRPAPPSSG